GTNGVVLKSVGTNYTSANDIFLQPDGRILVGGGSNSNSGTNFLVARFKPDGSSDTSFNHSGVATFHLGQQGSSDYIGNVALHENKILAAGNSDYYSSQQTQNNHRILMFRLLEGAPQFTPVITPAGPINGCQGTLVTLNSNQTGNHQWYYNGGVMPGANNAALTVNISGNYSVEVSNQNGCGISAPVSVSIHSSPPVPPLDYSGTPYQFSTTPGYAQYTWYFNNSVITGANSNTYTPTQAGNYTVRVTDANNCSTTSAVYNLVVLSTTELQVGDASLRFYPSPAYGLLNVDVQRASGKPLTAELYDLGGRLLHTQLLNRNHNEIPLKSLQAAVYLLVVSDGKVREVRKIVVIN
ncbi:MAG TPA: T9SS type A sorting domain-containing protein, partial [Chitinophagaceae bacterium]|nr:T9SS type A sorting domain-containing protein [Chitinophagaceae bacterium]